MEHLKEFVKSWINNKTGYVIELWFTEKNKPFIVSQHIRVFYQAYKRRPKNGYDLHHIDGDKTNNDLLNLIEVDRCNHKLLHRSREDGHYYDEKN